MAEAFYKGGGNLVEAKRSGGDGIQVLARFSTQDVDQEQDCFLKSAWSNEEDVQHFMKKGFVDWNHLYPINKKLAREALQKGRAKEYNDAEQLAIKSIVGQPEKLYVQDDGPYCQLRLYAKNEFIKAYEPALISHSDRFGVSAAGLTLRHEMQGGVRKITRARLSQISICPLLEAINDNTTISLVKSAAIKSQAVLQKSFYPEQDVQQQELTESQRKAKLLSFIMRYLCTQRSFGAFVKEEIKGFEGSHARLKEYFENCLDMDGEDAGELAALAMVEHARAKK